MGFIWWKDRHVNYKKDRDSLAKCRRLLKLIGKWLFDSVDWTDGGRWMRI
jgi:hypothetical protein